jgi:hypothetical protein
VERARELGLAIYHNVAELPNRKLDGAPS